MNFMGCQDEILYSLIFILISAPLLFTQDILSWSSFIFLFVFHNTALRPVGIIIVSFNPLDLFVLKFQAQKEKN